MTEVVTAPEGRVDAAEHAGPPASGTSPTDLRALALLSVRLRWRLSTNRLRRRGRRTRRLTLVGAVGYALLTIVALGSARITGAEFAGDTLVMLMSSMSIGWVFGPVLIGGVDETIDPTKLALLPLATAERFVIQLAGAVSGIGPVSATTGLLIGLAIGYTTLGAGIVVVPLAAVTIVLMLVGAARSLAAVLAIAQRSRAGRDLSVMLAALAGGAIFTLAQLAGDVLGEENDWLVQVLGWFPWAWPAHAINASVQGRSFAALGWLGASLVLAAMLLAAWARLSNHLLLHGERSAATRRRRGRDVLNGASTPFTVSMARQWAYLWRSPNSRVGLVFGSIFGVAFALVQIMQQSRGSGAAAAFGILLAMVANLGATTNVLGFDAGSLWIEVLAGGPGRPSMLARELIALPNLLLPTWLSGLVVIAWTGEWRLVLLVSLLAIPVAFNVLTFGTLASVLAPAPLPDWDNPFGNRQGNESRGLRMVLIVFVGLLAIILLSAPLFIVTIASLRSPWVWVAPLGGLAYTGLLFLVAIWWAGRYLSGREPGLVERLAPRALN